jgi:hypothetical protein
VDQSLAPAYNSCLCYVTWVSQSTWPGTSTSTWWGRCSRKSAVEETPLMEDCWLLFYLLVPESSSWFSAHRELVYWCGASGGSRCCHGNWKADKARQDGLLPVTQRSVYPHSCTHMHASSHTHWHEYIYSHWHPKAYVDRLCQAHKWPHGHIPINRQSSYFQKALLPTRKTCQYSCKIVALGRKNLGYISRKTSSTLNVLKPTQKLGKSDCNWVLAAVELQYHWKVGWGVRARFFSIPMFSVFWVLMRSWKLFSHFSEEQT